MSSVPNRHHTHTICPNKHLLYTPPPHPPKKYFLILPLSSCSSNPLVFAAACFTATLTFPCRCTQKPPPALMKAAATLVWVTSLKHNMDFIFSLVLCLGTRRAFQRDFHSAHMQIAVSFYRTKGHFVISSRNHRSVLSHGRWIVLAILIALFILWIWPARSQRWIVSGGRKLDVIVVPCAMTTRAILILGCGRTKGEEKGSPNVSSWKINKPKEGSTEVLPALQRHQK